MKCRFCKSELKNVFIDLFNSPASNSFLTENQLEEPEAFYPLKVYVCHTCFLVQVDEFKKFDSIFDNNYVYFSSYSKSWLEHAASYVNMMTERFKLNEKSQVVEVASNDGYLLQFFVQKNIPVLGIEPTANTAAAAKEKGVNSIIEFFSENLALLLKKQGKRADLLLGNNVLAHVPDIVDFVKGLKALLNEEGVITMEFPHLIQLIENTQFDTIYHEHFSYLSFTTVNSIFESCELTLFDVEELSTHGGSLRIYAKHSADETKKVLGSVPSLLKKEAQLGISKLEYYEGFQQKALKVKLDFLNFLINEKAKGKVIAAYGAAAKGNTLLNYCGIRRDVIDFVVDANPHKQGKFLPGSHIPVVNETYLQNRKPDYIVIFPWNIKQEIMQQLAYISDWKGKFLMAIPEFNISP